MKNIIFMFTLLIISKNVFAITFPNYCVQSGGNENCIEAAYSDWVHTSNKGTITTSGQLKITEDQAIGKIMAMYSSENTPQGYTWYEYKEKDEAERKITWGAEAWYNQAKLRHEAYDSTAFNLTRCIKSNQTGQTTCGGFGVGFKRTWACPSGTTGMKVEYRKDIITSYNRGMYGPDSVTAEKQYDDVSSKICIATNLGPTKYCKGNPCSITTGNKFQIETDYVSSNSLLKLQRIYNSLPPIAPNKNVVGNAWSFNLGSKISLWKYHGTEISTPVPASDSDLQKGHIFGTYTNSLGNVVYLFNLNENSDIFPKTWFAPSDKNIKILQTNKNDWIVEYSQKNIKEIYQDGKLIKVEQNNGSYLTLTYNNNLLTKVTDHFGRKLEFSYTSNGLLSLVSLPNNKVIIYQYDNKNRLSNINRPGYGIKTYHYNENTTVAPSNNPNLLTGITDEIGNRYANYAYDVQNRGILTEHAGGAQKYLFNHYDSYTSITAPNGIAWSYTKTPFSGTYQITNAQRQGVIQEKNSFDKNGNITQKTEKGLTTNYTYDLSRNLETSRTEAVGTAQERKIETTWHTDFPKPTEIKESSGGQVLRLTTYSYDNNGNALNKTITDPQTQEVRTWSYEYNNFGQLTKETNPLGQISSYQYDDINGNLLKTVSADGITTTYSQHNADGQPQHIESSNGQVLDLVYDDAGRILQQKQTVQQGTLSSNGHSLSWWQVLVNNVYQAFGADAPYSEANQTPEVSESISNQTAITTYEYDPRGLLVATTLPDGERIEYTYDDAHRLTEIKDQSGNRTIYTLNANGDITQTEVYGALGQLEAKNQQVYDNLGRLQKTLGNNQQSQTLAYDSYDQISSDKNALNQNYGYSYDVLGRQIKETDPLNGSSQTEYDALDQIKKVIDAKGGATSYQYNAFGEKIAQNSPDTGATAYLYQNGLLQEKTDALLLKHLYQYDAQGRVILQKDQKTDGSDQYEQTEFAYGQSGHDLGKLVLAKNKRSETVLSYNNLGLVGQKSIQYLTTQQSTAPTFKVHYSYTVGGKLKQLALPSGNIVNYVYNTTGQLIGIALNDQSFIHNIQYSANGLKGWVYSGVGDSVQFAYDLDGRITRINMPNVFDKNYSFDSADRILSITDSYQSLLNQSFKHDALSRLTEQMTAEKTFKYTYDKNSNRLMRQTVQGTTTNTENYTIASNSNRLTNIQQGTSNKAYQYLATGQITNDGVRSYTYDAQGRSETISRSLNTILNAYDAFGQRIQKFSTTAGSQSQTLFVYDENGQLLGEYSPDGKVIREYIWLDGTLVGLRSYQYPNEILRVHTDHLGTPRAISNNSNQVLWRWDGDQFGDVLPTGTLTFPIRHAGQYYDSEVGIFYNYFRDYDPITGRYIESDPIGLDGGLNTYGYVGGNALGAVDPTGEAAVGGVLNGVATLVRNCPIGRVVSLASNVVSSTSACDMVINPPENKCDNDEDDKCDEIRKNINYWVSELRRRYQDLKIDKSGLYRRQPNGPHSYAGHRAKFFADQKVLKYWVELAKVIPCSYNKEADDWLRKSAPTRPTPR